MKILSLGIKIVLIALLVSAYSRAHVAEPLAPLSDHHVTSSAQQNLSHNISHTSPKSATYAGDSRDWTVLVFIEARNNLSSFAVKNINEMMQVGSNAKTAVLAQVYQPHQKGCRYRVERGRIVSEGTVEGGNDCVRDLVESMRWAATRYPAKKYCLILWNHGLGITDPVWNSGGRFWGMSGRGEQSDNPRTQIEGITYEEAEEVVCDRSHRGILFNEIDRTYMNNQDMVRAFATISNQILGGKKLDLVGMDACLMAMVEVGYQLRNYVQYMVSSEEVELAQGWPYLTVLGSITATEMTPLQVAQSIVVLYEQYYKDKTYIYTQSAVELEYMSYVKQNIDEVVTCLQQCKNQKDFDVADVITKARRRCVQFSTPAFIDLYSFYEEIYKQLDMTRRVTVSYDSPRARSAETLKGILSNGMKLISSIVVANTAGPYLSRAKGLAIYFPYNRIDSSYHRTLFAQESLWADFIKQAISEM